MSKVLDVLLHGRLAGTLTNIAGDRNIFAFDDGFRADRTAPTFSWRALHDGVTDEYAQDIRPTRRRVHPFFANLLPEGELRTYIAQAARIDTERDFPLLWYSGEDLPGAIVIRDPDQGVPPPERALDRDTADKASVPVRFSLAGVQLKFSVSGSPGRGLTLPVGGAHGDGILKLPDRRFARVPETEFAMMTFARTVGIDVPATALVDPRDVLGLPPGLTNAGGPAYWIKRFDRRDDGTARAYPRLRSGKRPVPRSKVRRFQLRYTGRTGRACHRNRWSA